MFAYIKNRLLQKKKEESSYKVYSVEEMYKELLKEIETFSAHSFHAQWQHDQYNKITENIPEATVIMVMDFPENFTCFYQNEIQGAYWGKNVVTIHPIVCFYLCPQHNVPVREYLDFITADSHAVAEFVTRAVTHLGEERGLSVCRIIQFTDGCSAQYKSKTQFFDISQAMPDLNTTMERDFFGSCHGKGPCDGEGGVIKNSARRAAHNNY
ncbi:uncharacterized protein LOC117121038 [Anneissia japonica]|uniref:uncharacterized protein LOC117121038 n=1 Tax=Anneissia japonica TaxID=1529436 RepID=UPI0014256BCA|nr:uncharacterized protein LOC117121038 [Anneissia japonica]